ncbi:MAG: LysR family transcriptional regulator [Hoeflea sp.]
MQPSLNSIASRLRLKHFRLLVAIDDCGSLLKAASAVAMSQPGATKALREIEETLGQQLFIRTSRGLEATELGRCVIRHARFIQNDIAHLRDEMAGIQLGHGGRLAVGAIMGAVPMVSEKVSKLLASKPAMSVEMVEDTSVSLLKLLDDGRLDAALCRISVSHHWDMYDAVCVREERLVVVSSRDHPAAGAKRVELASLAECPWIACAANMPMRRYLEREFAEAGIQFPQNLVETTSAFSAVSMMQKNPKLVALLPSDVAEFWVESRLLTTLNVDLQAKAEPYYLVTCRKRTLTPVTQLFLDQFEPLEMALPTAAE